MPDVREFLYRDLENVYACSADEFTNYIRTINDLIEKNFEAFIRIPYDQRVLFLPHCMRNAERCKAKNTDIGYVCMECGACAIRDIKREAESLGYDVYIVGGGRIIYKILSTTEYKGVVGIACPFELADGLEKVTAVGLPPFGMLLTRDGCMNTQVDLDTVIRGLRLKAD